MQKVKDALLEGIKHLEFLGMTIMYPYNQHITKNRVDMNLQTVISQFVLPDELYLEIARTFIKFHKANLA